MKTHRYQYVKLEEVEHQPGVVGGVVLPLQGGGQAGGVRRALLQRGPVAAAYGNTEYLHDRGHRAAADH